MLWQVRRLRLESLEVNANLAQECPYVSGKMWDEFLLQLDDVSQQLHLLRYRASSWSRAHEQILDEQEAAQRE